MAKHLPEPPGEPDPGAQDIIEAIHAYRDSDRPPLQLVAGLRHIYYRAELAWDASLARCKPVSTFAAMAEATGNSWGTIQGRIRAHRFRERGERPRDAVGRRGRRSEDDEAPAALDETGRH